MTNGQEIFVLGFLILNLCVFLKGFFEVKKKKNPYGLTKNLFFLGMFVWGDVVVFGLFWTIAGIISLLAMNWYLFCFIVSVFWVVRSLGETVYWLNQQFASMDKNPIQSLLFNSIFDNDSLWFVYQIIWQCVMIGSIITSVYFGYLWLTSL